MFHKNAGSRIPAEDREQLQIGIVVDRVVGKVEIHTLRLPLENLLTAGII